MKKVIWSLVAIGIIGTLIFIFILGDSPIIMVSFFGLYLLAIFAVFNYFFEMDNTQKDILPDMLSRENMIIQ